MPLLTNPSDSNRVVRDLKEWRQTLLSDLPPRAEPLFVPRNTRGRALVGQNQVRFEWDPGSSNLDGFDVSWSNKPNFETSQSSRLQDPKALFLDVPAGEGGFLYLRVRAFINEQISAWSPTAKVATEAARQLSTGGLPGLVSYTVRVDEPGILTIDDISVSNADEVNELHIFAPSVDESDLGIYGTIPGALGLQDPALFTPVITDGSRLGHHFKIGDFILIDDGTISAGKYSYEAAEITKIDSITGGWTISRKGQFGAGKVAHGAGKRFYRVDMRRFEYPVGPNGFSEPGVPKIFKPLDPNQCVIATVVAAKTAAGYGPWNLKGLIPLPADTKSLAAAGLRTKNGGQYTLGLPGSLSAKQTADLWIAVSQWAGIRSIFGRVKKIGTDVKLYVLYVGPPLTTGGSTESQRKVAMFPEMTIPVGRNHTYDPTAPTGNPDGRNTPYLGSWPFVSLPTIGTMATLFDGTGAYIGPLPPVPDGGSVLFGPDGHLVPLCGAIGTGTAPADCTIEVQT